MMRYEDHLPCKFAYGNRHVVRLMQLSFDFYMLEAKADHRFGDRAAVVALEGTEWDGHLLDCMSLPTQTKPYNINHVVEGTDV